MIPKCDLENDWLRSEVERLKKKLAIANGILNDTLAELPVGNVTTHTHESIPERVAYYVAEHARNESKA